MSLGFSMSLRQAPQLSQRQTLSQQQRHTLLLGHKLSLRCSLLQTLRGDEYKPDGNCEKCGRKLTPAEIVSGFNQDPRDFTTCCTGCGHRFQPKLICIGAGGATRIELPFFCDAQMLDQLRQLEHLEPEQIAHDQPAVYRAAIFHRGTLKAAFAEINIEYVLEKPLDWQDKLAPFLGKLADSVIAECAGITIRKVRIMRRKLNIEAYSVSRTLENLDESD